MEPLTEKGIAAPGLGAATGKTEESASLHSATGDCLREEDVFPEHFPCEVGDCLSATCPHCGEAAEYPDCANCGKLLDDPVETATAKPPEKLIPDIEEARRFFDFMFDDPDARLSFQTFDDDKTRKSKNLAKVYHATLNQCASNLESLQQHKAGVFYMVNAGDFQGRSAANVTSVRYLFADTDGAPLDPLKALKPHAIVESSPGNWHVYWRVSDCELSQFAQVQRSIADKFGTDTSMSDLCRVLRVPGFYHQKGTPFQVRIVELSGHDAYTLAEIKTGLALHSAKPEGNRPEAEQQPLASGEPYVGARTLHDLRSALCWIDADDRDLWVKIGHALKTLGRKGEGLFFEWSQKSDKFDAGAISKEWRGFQPTRTDYKVVFAEAQKNGWLNPLSNVAGGTQQPSGIGQAPSIMLSIPEQPAPAAGNGVPFDLTRPPGLAGEIADYIFRSSRNPVLSFAYAGALQVIAHLNANTKYVRGSETALNLYQCLVGATGSGKEDPRKAFKRLVGAVKPKNLLPIPPSICEGVSSGPALVRVLVDNPNITILSDEFGLFLQSAMSDRGSTHLKELVKELLSFYSLGRSYYAGKPYADAKYSIPRFDRPYVNVLGTTTPLELIDGITGKSVDNGFLNRIFMVQMSEERPINREPDLSIADDLISRLETLGCEPGGIEYGAGVHDFMVECSEGMAGNRRRKDNEFANLWARAEEQMVRVAGVLAIGDGGTITRDHIAWAHAYVAWSIQSFANLLGTDLAETVFEKNIKKAESFILNARHYAGDSQFGAICKKGVMPQSKLLKLMKLPARDLADVLDYFFKAEIFFKGNYEGYEILYKAENLAA